MPTFALNFYNPAVAEQLRTGRKTATIRLGDKAAKYRKGMIVTVLCGARFGQRERIFDAVIDKVEVKPLRDLSPREIEHDNPQIRRVDEMVWFLSQLYNREVERRRDRHAHSLLADRSVEPPDDSGDDGHRGNPEGELDRRRKCLESRPEACDGQVGTCGPVVAQGEQPEPDDEEREAELGQRENQNDAQQAGGPTTGEHREPTTGRTRSVPIACVLEATARLLGAHLPGRRIAVPKSSASRTGAPHSSHATANADGIGAAQLGQRWRSSPAHWGHAAGSSFSSSRK